MTIREFIEREEKQNKGLTDNIKRAVKRINKSCNHESRIMAAYEIKGMLFALLYSKYITADEFESLIDDWIILEKNIYK